MLHHQVGENGARNDRDPDSDDRDRRTIYISEGLAHGFLALQDNSTVMYLCSAEYNPQREHTICATDPALGIDWLPELRDFHRHVATRGVATPGAARLTEGIDSAGIGRWREHAGEMAPVLPVLQPWIERFGYA